jgi:hypothetical protein
MNVVAVKRETRDLRAKLDWWDKRDEQESRTTEFHLSRMCNLTRLRVTSDEV